MDLNLILQIGSILTIISGIFSFVFKLGVMRKEIELQLHELRERIDKLEKEGDIFYKRLENIKQQTMDANNDLKTLILELKVKLDMIMTRVTVDFNKD